MLVSYLLSQCWLAQPDKHVTLHLVCCPNWGRPPPDKHVTLHLVYPLKPGEVQGAQSWSCPQSRVRYPLKSKPPKDTKMTPEIIPQSTKFLNKWKKRDHSKTSAFANGYSTYSTCILASFLSLDHQKHEPGNRLPPWHPESEKNYPSVTLTRSFLFLRLGAFSLGTLA